MVEVKYTSTFLWKMGQPYSLPERRGMVQIARPAKRPHLFQELVRDSSPLEVLRGPTGKGDPFERLRIAVDDRRGRRLQSLRD